MSRSLSRSPYRTVRTIFGILFLLSIFVSISSGPVLESAGEENERVTIISLITSLTSLIGFFSTIALEWRRELREAEEAEREAQRELLELEKLRLEIEKMHEAQKAERERSTGEPSTTTTDSVDH
jgi:predicted hydrocarbon binding protein